MPGATRAARRDDLVIVIVGLGAGVAVVAAGCRPTGSVSVDAVLVPVSVAGAVWLCSFARWWALAALGAIAAAFAGETWAMALGIAATLGAIGIRLRLVDHPVVPPAIAAASMVALATIGDVGRFGASSAVALLAVGGCCIVGLVELDGFRRRRALVAIGAATGVAVLAVAGLGLAAQSARSDLAAGNDAANEALDFVQDGELDEARASFAEASVRFRRAATELQQPWAQLSRIVPIAAQHRRAATELTGAASSTARTLDAELATVDIDALRIVDGRIDIDAVVALEAPLARVNAAVERLERTLQDSTSGWLVAPAKERVDELAESVADQRELGAKAAEALTVIPAMLGAEGERVYLLMFTTPAEARGQGGFMGNYAELTAVDGEVSLSDFGRHGDLSTRGGRPRTLPGAPDDWMGRYGPFGYTTGPDDSVGDVPWANITISPHFPSTAQVVAELYPQSGGRELDGVLNLDVFALDELAGLIGPLEVEGAPFPLTGANTASFLLVDQYEIADFDARTDLLEDVALETVELILGDAAPDPVEFGRRIRPLARQHRAMAWSAHPDEQAVLSDAGLTAELLADRDDADALAVTVVNASASKIETFLSRRFTLTERDDGRMDLELEFLSNPPLQLPDYVVGNAIGLPRGSSRLFVSIHTTMRLVDAHEGDDPTGLQPSFETGLPVYSGYLDLSPGEPTSWIVTLEPVDGTGMVLQPQPLVQTEVWTLDIAGADFPWTEGADLFETLRLPANEE